MEGINESVVRQLKEQKGGEQVLPLWEKLWSAYQEEGARGVDTMLAELTNRTSDQE